MKRLLGYIVKLPDGTRSPLLVGVVSLTTAQTVALGQAPAGSYVSPVFSKPKPAPVAAAEGRYAVLVDQRDAPHFVNFGLDLTAHVSDRDAMEYERDRAMVGRKASDAPVKLVRVLYDGEHEAAVAAARREERGRVLRELRGTLVQCCVDFAEDEAHAGGLAHAVRCLEDLVAAKGQAK